MHDIASVPSPACPVTADARACLRERGIPDPSVDVLRRETCKRHLLEAASLAATLGDRELEHRIDAVANPGANAPAAADLLAVSDTSRADLVAMLRRAQAERDDLLHRVLNSESALDKARIEIGALHREVAEARGFGDPANPLSVARSLLARVELHEFADGLALIAEAREWARIAC